MGMSASQARFLGLTARKNNTEFEGQQINQQRTTLSNQSANYYNQLLGMSVPVPPSTTDYTKTVYSFDDGILTNSITSMLAQTDGTYLVSYMQSWTNDFTPVSAGTAITTRSGDTESGFTYSIGSQNLRTMGSELTINVTKDGTAEQLTLKKDDDGNWAYYNGKDKVEDMSAYTKGTIEGFENDEYYNSLTFENLKNVMKEEDSYDKLLDNKYNEGKDTNWMVRYVKNTSTNEYVAYFYKESKVENVDYDDNGHSKNDVQVYKIGSATENKEVKGKTAELEKDSTGRYVSITLEDGDTKTTYSLTTNTVTDENAYNDAMNQYYYDKAEYDKQIQEINAKIEVVQAQDKNLELRLKQLDTEQDAISNELDAVTKVIEKNVESSFKTFG